MKRYVKSYSGVKSGMEISKVSLEKLNEILDSADSEPWYRPYGYFYAYDPRDKKTPWIAMDNGGGHAWTEAFATEDQAIAWLNGEFEIGDDA